MNTKTTTIWFTLYFIIVFLFNWFLNEISEIFTPFLIIFPCLLIAISFIIMLIWAIIHLIKHIKIRHYKATIPLLIIGFIVIIQFVFPFSLAKVDLEFTIYTSQRNEVVSAIKSHELGDDGYGNIVLPLKYRYLSSDGEAYVYINNKNKTIVGFWVARGMLCPYTSVIYSSSGIAPSNDDLGSAIISIKKLNNFWYYVNAN